MTPTITIQQLSTMMAETGFNNTYKDRFNRILKFFGHTATQADVIAFLTMIVDHEQDYKRTNDIVSKWKKPKSVSDIFSCIINVCNIPKVKEQLGDRYQEVTQAHEAYIKTLMEAARNNNEISVPPPTQTPLDQTHAAHTDLIEDANGSLDDYPLTSECGTEVQPSAQTPIIAPQPKISESKLRLYIQLLRSAESAQVARVIADIIEHDLNN